MCDCTEYTGLHSIKKDHELLYRTNKNGLYTTKQDSAGFNKTLQDCAGVFMTKLNHSRAY